MSNRKEIQAITDLNSFINKLQKEDKVLEQIYKLIKIAYIVLIVVYIPILYSEFKDGGTISIVKISCIFLGFITFLILSGYMQKKQKSLDYSIPTLQLLKNTVKRYRLFSERDIVGIIGFSLIMFGLIINEKRYLAYQKFMASETTFGTYWDNFWNALQHLEISSLSKFGSEHQFIIFSILLAVAVLLYILSILMGYFLWRSRFKPIRNNALSLLRELEN